MSLESLDKQKRPRPKLPKVPDIDAFEDEACKLCATIEDAWARAISKERAAARELKKVSDAVLPKEIKEALEE